LTSAEKEPHEDYTFGRHQKIFIWNLWLLKNAGNIPHFIELSKT